MNYVQAHAELHEEPCCRFAQFDDYQAESWSHPRRIIAKCEVTAQGGPNRRFVVTNLDGSAGGGLSRPVCEAWELSRTRHPRVETRTADGSSLVPPVLRQCVHSAVPRLGVRVVGSIPGSELGEVRKIAECQLQTVQTKLFKVGALAQASARRIWFRISASWPGRDLFARVCEAVSNSPSALGPALAGPPRRSGSRPNLAQRRSCSNNRFQPPPRCHARRRRGYSAPSEPKTCHFRPILVNLTPRTHVRTAPPADRSTPPAAAPYRTLRPRRGAQCGLAGSRGGTRQTVVGMEV